MIFVKKVFKREFVVFWSSSDYCICGFTTSGLEECDWVGYSLVVVILCGSSSGSEILLGEGGDVELGARTSKHIFLFAFDQLALNSLSFICVLHHSYCHILYACVVPCIYSYCSFILYAWLMCMCVPHLCLTTRASCSASTLIQKNQEELVQSSSREIRLHSLVALSVVAD